MAVTYPPDFRGSVWSLRHRATADPLAFLEGLAAGPDDVVPFSLAGRPAFLLKHPDFAESVLVSHHHKFAKADGLQRAERLLGSGLLTAEGERHRQQRSEVQPAFHRQKVEGYGEVMVGHAARLAETWSPERVLDISAEAGALTLAIVGEAVFGADVESLSAEVRHALKTASDAVDPLISLLAPMRRVRPQRARLMSAIDSLLEQGEATSFSRDDALTLLLAGHDTIATALVWTWILLAQHPDVAARMEREVDAILGSRPATAADVPALGFTRQVLAESLRLYPPSWVLARRALDDHELGGVRLPEGSIALISQYLMHRDARFFPDPLQFDPDRWREGTQARRPTAAYFPFGAGPRACIGEGFAWMEGVLVLATVAQRWRLRLARPDDPIRPHPKITLRPPAVGMVPERRGPRR